MSAPAMLSTRLSRRVGYALLGVLLVVFVALLLVLLLLAQREPPLPQSQTALRVLNILYGPGEGAQPLFDHPMGVAYSKDGRLYVADTGHNRIVVFDEQGEYLFTFGGLGVAKPAVGGRFTWEPGLFNYPTDVAVDTDGSVYVADFRNDQIQVFDPGGKFLRAFPDRTKRVGKGSSGQGGTGIAVSSIAVKDGRVYATDKYQILTFDTAGTLLEQFGKPGSEPADLDHPNGVAIGPAQVVAVSDSNHNRIVGLSPRGKFMWAVGEQFGPAVGEDVQRVEVPRGASFTPDGTLVVADAMASRLMTLSETGEILGVYGQYGSSPGDFALPTDVACFSGWMAVAEKGGNRVQVVAIEEE